MPIRKRPQWRTFGEKERATTSGGAPQAGRNLLPVVEIGELFFGLRGHLVEPLVDAEFAG
jgi:hypothetical protein